MDNKWLIIVEITQFTVHFTISERWRVSDQLPCFHTPLNSLIGKFGLYHDHECIPWSVYGDRSPRNENIDYHTQVCHRSLNLQRTLHTYERSYSFSVLVTVMWNWKAQSEISIDSEWTSLRNIVLQKCDRCKSNNRLCSWGPEKNVRVIRNFELDDFFKMRKRMESLGEL